MNMMPAARSYSVLSAAWSFLALSLRYPDADLALAVAEGAWGATALDVASGLREHFDACVAVADEVSKVSLGDEGACLHALRREATRLFIGSPDAALTPFEGVWRSRDDGSAALLAVNPHSVEVERFCRQCGLSHPKGTNEPLDHVSAECELLSFLAYKACEEALGTAVDSDTPGGSARAAYDAFCADHAKAWMPQLADELEKASDLEFYRVTAKVLRATARMSANQ